MPALLHNSINSHTCDRLSALRVDHARRARLSPRVVQAQAGSAPQAEDPVGGAASRPGLPGHARLRLVMRRSSGAAPYLVPVSTLHRGEVKALAYAEAIRPGNVPAVHINMDLESPRKVQERWASGVTVLKFAVVVLDSPYRSLVRPLLNHIEEVDQRSYHDMSTVNVSECVPARWWHHLLHNQTLLLIKRSLLFRKNKVVTSGPYRLAE